jgi:uncharacterized membrane protein required for colicin V production
MPQDLNSILQTTSQHQPVHAGDGASTLSKQASAILKRYRDAYRVARVTNGFGVAIKVLGLIGAGLLVLLGAAVASDGPRNPLSLLGVLGIAFGLFAGALFFIIGVMVSAQGQILKASLDGAVNSSPFLTNEHRARIMSLPEA